MKAKRWLERAEYASLGLSALGTVAAAVSQQIIYAAAPLTLALSLNTINRQRESATLLRRTLSFQSQSLQLLASGQKQEVQAAIATITTEINQQLATIQPYKYQLIFDPIDSRAVMLEALTQAQERVIIVSPWLRQAVLDELRSPLKNALNRGVRVDIGFAHEGNIGFVLTESPQGWAYQQNWDRQKNYSALPDWWKLQKCYPNLTLKPLGTHEKYLVCDSAWAFIGSHNLLSAGTNGKQREIGLRTDDPRIVAELVERFDRVERI